jgi:extradiol dioxygenase
VNIRSLSYVAIEVEDIDAWEQFVDEFLGMPTTRVADDRLLARMDERSYRLDIRASSTDGLRAIGWEVPTQADLTRLVSKLQQHGVTPIEGSAAEARERGVLGFASFADPGGWSHEVFYGQEADFRPWTLTRPMEGYLTGEMGMGHIVIGVREFQSLLSFYVDVLGFRLSDMYQDSIAFLHCNPRHHSIALVATDRPGLRHIMFETRTIDDLGIALDIAKGHGYLTRTLGRHTNDRAVSFYVQTPSKWEIEYGWSGLKVDEEVWTVRQIAGPTSLWGHEIIGGPGYPAATEV